MPTLYQILGTFPRALKLVLTISRFLVSTGSRFHLNFCKQSPGSFHNAILPPSRVLLWLYIFKNLYLSRLSDGYHLLQLMMLMTVSSYININMAEMRKI